MISRPIIIFLCDVNVPPPLKVATGAAAPSPLRYATVYLINLLLFRHSKIHAVTSVPLKYKIAHFGVYV